MYLTHGGHIDTRRPDYTLVRYSWRLLGFVNSSRIGPSAHFEFIEREEWAKDRSVTRLGSGMGGT